MIILCTILIPWIILSFFLLFEFALKVMEAKKKGWEQADGLQNENATWFKEYATEWKKAFSLFRWEPYVYWKPDFFQGKYININEYGLRSTSNPEKIGGHQSPFRIFMFGGSTMWGAGARDHHTIASALSRLLSDAGVDARISNYAQLGYVNSQEIISLLSELKKDNIPTLAIFYDGFNDVFSALTNSEAGIPLKENNRRDEFNIIQSSRRMVAAFFRNFHLYQLFCAKGNGRQPPGNGVDTDENQLSEDVVRVVRSNIRLLETLGVEYGFSTLFYWQPTIFHKSQLTEYEQKQARMIEHGRAFFTTTYHKITSCEALSQKKNFHYIADLFKDTSKPYYIDFGHITEGGNLRVAKRMAVDVVKAIHQHYKKKD